jgi:osmotically-inducible protein OsmY
MALSGCVSNIFTGANLVYDRHHVYIKVTDFQLNAAANRALYHDKRFKREDCALEVAVLNRDLLLTGQVPSAQLRTEAYQRIAAIDGKRRFFNQLEVTSYPADAVLDSWITTKIRSQIFADADINPSSFKVVTSNQVVYLMGDVDPVQARKVIGFARNCNRVKRVVTLLKYYHLSEKLE